MVSRDAVVPRDAVVTKGCRGFWDQLNAGPRRRKRRRGIYARATIPSSNSDSPANSHESVGEKSAPFVAAIPQGAQHEKCTFRCGTVRACTFRCGTFRCGTKQLLPLRVRSLRGYPLTAGDSRRDRPQVTAGEPDRREPQTADCVHAGGPGTLI